MSEFTQILAKIETGEPLASETLLPLVYEELRKLAATHLALEMPGQTLQATALVHEAYLRLVGSESPVLWNSRRHFFCAAAEAMRRILIERARRQKALKRGSRAVQVELTDDLLISSDRGFEVLEIDEALTELERHDAQAAQLVKLRYFAGLGHLDAAELMGIERRAADRLWLLARTWLFQFLRDNSNR